MSELLFLNIEYKIEIFRTDIVITADPFEEGLE